MKKDKKSHISAKDFIRKKEEAFKKEKKEFDSLEKEGKKIPKRLLIGMKDISRETKVFFVRLDWRFIKQYNMDEKVFIIEKLQKYSVDNEKDLAYSHSYTKGDIEYRICYYIIGQNGKKKGKWTWGQFCPLVPKEDMNKLKDELLKM